MSETKKNKESGEKWIKCVNCSKRFTQTIHKGKKSTPVCPHCGTYNTINEDVFDFMQPKKKSLAASKDWFSPSGSKINTFFETAQGSKYLRTENGETKRYKSEHSNDWDSGKKDWFSNSIFVPEKDEKFANAGQFLFGRNYKVALANAQGKKVFVIFDNGWRPAKWKDAYPKHAERNPQMADKFLAFDFTTNPKMGYNVVEFNFKSNGTLQSYHFGSPVSKISKFNEIEDDVFNLFL